MGYAQLTITQAIIYCNTCAAANVLAEQLTERGFTDAVLHAELDQAKRDSVMHDFRSGACRNLISADSFIRGIDLGQGPLFINYELPTTMESYLLRMGRSCRFG